MPIYVRNHQHPGYTHPSHVNLCNSLHTLYFTPISHPTLILERGSLSLVPSGIGNLLLQAKSSISARSLNVTFFLYKLEFWLLPKEMLSLLPSQSDCFASHSPGRNHWSKGEVSVLLLPYYQIHSPSLPLNHPPSVALRLMSLSSISHPPNP